MQTRVRIITLDVASEQDNGGAEIIDFSMHRARRMLRDIENEYLSQY